MANRISSHLQKWATWGDCTTCNTEFVAVVEKWTWSSRESVILVMSRVVVSSTFFLVGLVRWRSTVATTVVMLVKFSIFYWQCHSKLNNKMILFHFLTYIVFLESSELQLHDWRRIAEKITQLLLGAKQILMMWNCNIMQTNWNGKGINLFHFTGVCESQHFTG